MPQLVAHAIRLVTWFAVDFLLVVMIAQERFTKNKTAIAVNIVVILLVFGEFILKV